MRNPIPDAAEWLFDEYDAPRFWSRVDFNGGQAYLNDPLARIGADDGECWNWTRLKDEDGYGHFKLWGVQTMAHRLAYRDFGFALSREQHIDHLCRNASCVRPNHLEAVDQRTNVDRGLRGRPANPSCKNGHEWTAENTKWVQPKPHRYPYRECQACVRGWKQSRYASTKASAIMTR